MKIEISRKQFMAILAIVENDAEKADNICKIIEEDVPRVARNASQVMPSDEDEGPAPGSFIPETKPMNGFGKNVRSIGGITE